MSGPLRKAFVSIGVFFMLMWSGLALTIYLAVKDHEPPLIAHPELSRQSDFKKGRAAIQTDWPDSLAGGKRELRLALQTNDTIQDIHSTIRIERPASLKDHLVFELDSSDGSAFPDGIHFVLPVDLRTKGVFDLFIRIIYNKNYEVFYHKRFQVH